MSDFKGRYRIGIGAIALFLLGAATALALAPPRFMPAPVGSHGPKPAPY